MGTIIGLSITLLLFTFSNGYSQHPEIIQFGTGQTEFSNGVNQRVSSIEMQWVDASTIAISWTDQKHDLLSLTQSVHLPDIETSCTFTATLEQDIEGGAIIVGCIDSESTIVNIASSEFGIFELILLGNGTTLEQTFQDQPKMQNNITKSRKKRATFTKIDYVEIPQLAPNTLLTKQANDEDFLYPDAINFPLELGYDSRFHNHFSQNKQRIESFIHDVIHLSSFYFKHTKPKLPSVINWIIQPNIKFLSNLNISADELCQNRRNVAKIKIVKEMRRVTSVPFMIFAEDIMESLREGEAGGCAHIGVACGNMDGNAWGVTDMNWALSFGYTEANQKQAMARTMAHELGHMLGFRHDFDHNPSTGCNNTGVMSYGSETAQNKGWSTCSTSDFKKFWKNTGMTCGLDVLPEPPVCPIGSETDRACPVLDMVAVTVTGNGPMNCMFECPFVTKTIQSTNLDDTRGSGYRCDKTNYDSAQFSWCCKSKTTSGGVPQCPTEEEVNCPEFGCPVEHLRSYYVLDAPRIDQDCQPECDMVNLPDSGVMSGFRCNKLQHFQKALNYCCANHEAVTSIPTCP